MWDFLWTDVITRPMANGLVFLYSILGSNFGLAIIAFTLISRVALYPLTKRQIKQQKAMLAMQPKMKEIEEKFKNDPQRKAKEQMKLWKETGVNPLGCLGPFIFQFLIWVGLYSALRTTLADTPEGLVKLSQQIYTWLPYGDGAVPLHSSFAGLDLARSDPTIITLPILVGLSTYVVQKMVTVQSSDPQTQQRNNMMNLMMPFIMAIFTFGFPSGLALYWITSNVVTIWLQYRVMGWGGLTFKRPSFAPAPAGATPGGASASPKQQVELKEVKKSVEKSVEKPAEKAAAPEAPRPADGEKPQGVGGLLKRVFLGSPPAAKPEDAAKAADSSGDGAAVAKGEGSGTDRNERQDGGRGNREGARRARRRERQRRNRGS
ncbi:MAG: YidC/Oxa1 family membrane protein insertase [Chloroflexi bacterium]|nr:YidC/Oxa1 family membrane protein insertase [Chloroflexota bacterium]